MKQAQSTIQTLLLAALCVIGVLIFFNTREEPTDPGIALQETLSSWP